MKRSAHRSAIGALARRTFLGRVVAVVAGSVFLGRFARSHADVQVDEQYLGEIRLFAGGYAPRGWAFCNGQLLSINQNQGLFAILSTTYGGNGQTTFALPDLRGRVAIHHGQGPELSNRALGDRGGEERHTLTIAEVPAHTHVARASSAVGTSADASGLYPARNAAQIPQWGPATGAFLATNAITSVGSGQSHENLQPYLTVSFIIATTGMFPPQSP